MNQSIQLTSDGDVELWVIRRDQWAIPVYAIPATSGGESYFVVSVAVFCDGQMYKVLSEIMSGARKTQDGQYIVVRGWLESVATKAQGVTPDYYLNRPDATKTEKAQSFYSLNDVPEESNLTERFINEVCATGVGKREVVKIMFVAIRNTAMRWLVEKRLPLDLGFVVLYPVPFRANWKQFIDCWLRPMISNMRKGRAERDVWLKDQGFDLMVRDSNIMAMDDKTKCIDWNIEAVTGDQWDDAVASSEQNSRAAKGEVRYYERVMRMVENAYEYAHEIYRSWVEKTHRQTASVHEGHLPDSLVIRPNASSIRKRPDHYRGRKGPRPEYAPTIEAQGGPKLVIKETTPMLQVSNVQPTIANVRFTRRPGKH